MLVVGIVFLALLGVFLGIFIPISKKRAEYRNLIFDHSKGLRTINEINEKYVFSDIPNYDLSHRYDNENFYNTISPEDYLIYQLVFIRGNVRTACKNAEANAIKYREMVQEISERVKLRDYDIPVSEKNWATLDRMEEKIIKSKYKHPKTTFSIQVRLSLTNINGEHIRSKSDTFDAKHIISLINRINQKRGSYYSDEEIFHAICRVERGKVTNRMRFAIYKRDGNRCRKCGSTRNLEVDHIIPIAKGGKSTMDNLQTLCHRCNVKKGANIE